MRDKWCPLLLLSALFTPLGTRGQTTTNACLDPTNVVAYRCTSEDINLSGCALVDDDLDDLASCFNNVGRSDITEVDLSDNTLSALPAGIFQGLTSLVRLDFGGNAITVLPSGLFQGLTSLEELYAEDNLLTALPADIFQGLTSLVELDLDKNNLEELPAGVFQDLASLEDLELEFNNILAIPADTFQGLTALSFLYLGNNEITSLEAGAFGGMPELYELYLGNNEIDSLEAGAFGGLTSLEILDLGSNNLDLLPVDSFQGLTSMTELIIWENTLTTLPEGLFDDLTSLSNLKVVAIPSSTATNNVQCLPVLPSNPTVESETPAGTCECEFGGMSAEDSLEFLCGADETCQPGTTGYECEMSGGGTGDPHMVGFSGQKFDFTGTDGSWYAVLKDGRAHINMRVTAPLPELNVITYITGISIKAADLDGHMHTMLVYVERPDALNYTCPAHVSPCLANGALTILLDGINVASPSEVTLGHGVSFGAVNLPGECRPFGFEKYWKRKILDAEEAAAAHGRRLEATVGVSMAEWILSDGLATNKPECEAYVEKAGDDLFTYQSEHVSFQLTTPTFSVRLNYGKLHQLEARDPTDQFDLPDHITHQMNLGLSRVILGTSPEGILGETAAVRTDMHGVPIMTGISAISGNEEDYMVEGALGTSFQQASK